MTAPPSEISSVPAPAPLAGPHGVRPGARRRETPEAVRAVSSSLSSTKRFSAAWPANARPRRSINGATFPRSLRVGTMTQTSGAADSGRS